METLTKEQGRAVAVRAQQLDGERRDDLLAVVSALTHLPVNVTDIVAPSAEHIAYTRLGESISFDDVRRAAEVELSLFEHLDQPIPTEPLNIMLRPVSDLPLLRGEMEAWAETHPRTAAWVEANAGFRDDVLETLRMDGPVPQPDIEDTATVPWRSSGWNTSRNVAMMLEALQGSGEVAVAERRGAVRVWDLASRILPEVEALGREEASAELDRRRLVSLGLARPKWVGDAGREVRVEGTRGLWRLEPDAELGPVARRVSVLSPLDRLLLPRTRMRDLWGFDYALEQYTPAAKRRWGAFALPVLHGADLVGKVDARSDREAGLLRVAAFHWDVEADAALRGGVAEELERFAAWLGLGLRLP